MCCPPGGGRSTGHIVADDRRGRDTAPVVRCGVPEPDPPAAVAHGVVGDLLVAPGAGDVADDDGVPGGGEPAVDEARVDDRRPLTCRAAGLDGHGCDLVGQLQQSPGTLEQRGREVRAQAEADDLRARRTHRGEHVDVAGGQELGLVDHHGVRAVEQLRADRAGLQLDRLGRHPGARGDGLGGAVHGGREHGPVGVRGGVGTVLLVGGHQGEGRLARPHDAEVEREHASLLPGGGAGRLLRGRGRPGRGGALAAHHHPALDRALACAAQAQGPGRDVLGDHRSGRRVGAVADRHRGDQHRVRPDPDLVADDRGVLGHAVVVDEDRRGPDVGALADRGVAHVGQVRHLRAGADLGVLDLHVRPGLGPLAQDRARVAGT